MTTFNRFHVDRYDTMIRNTYQNYEPQYDIPIRNTYQNYEPQYDIPIRNTYQNYDYEPQYDILVIDQHIGIESPFMFFMQSTNQVSKTPLKLKALTETFTKLESDCSICLMCDDEAVSETVTCKHKFHTTCINSWLSKNNTCPLCRHQD